MIRSFGLNNEGITAGTELVQKYLEKKGIRGKEQSKAVLAAEESLTDLVAHSSGEGKLRVYVRFFPGAANAVFSAKGPEYDFVTSQDADLASTWDDDESDVGDAIRQLILESSRKNLKYQHRYGRNTVRLTVEHHTKSLYLTLGALAAAILCGIAVGLIGEHSRILKELFEACNDLFLRIIGIIMKITPLAVFCSILSLVLKTGISCLLSLLGIVGTFLFGLVCMILIYFLILLLIKLNPLSFFRKYAPVMLEVFSIASSSAAIPINMDACRDRIGVSPKIYKLSIPLGATLNMDGTCILLGVQTLALAKICGVNVSAGMLVSLGAMIIILSLGAPGVPGAVVILTSLLLNQLNVPVESVSLVIGIGPIMGMFICMSNCLGDAVVTTVVAKNEGQLDLNILNAKRHG